MTTVPRVGEKIEILNPNHGRGQIRHVLFDFDGTLSLVREGWQNVMTPLLVDTLIEAGAKESPEELRLLVLEWVTRLTGRQTIYQMIELAEQVKKRGGTPLDPVEYKHEYLRRLDERITDRINGLAAGTLDPASLLIPGSIELLEALRKRGVRIYLASGTDEPFVLREAKLLGLTDYFDGGIYGAVDDYKAFSKAMVIERILKEHHLEGPELLGIGDGYVEIENTKAVGGVALGVASFESDPVDFDAWKKERLARAGADVMVPNFVEYEPLLDYLFSDGR